jgi:ribosomal protein S18 acetylase RimI-like enzyme
MNITLSAVDEERFGIRTARASAFKQDDLPSVLDFCHANHVDFLIARCPGCDLASAQAMEQHGFLLMDSLIYYARPLKTPVPALEISVRRVVPEEAEKVSALAAEAFRDYGGHYHADSRLDRGKCDEVYPSWAYRSCVSRQVADEVLVTEQEGEIVGFVTLKSRNLQEGEIPLYGVLPTLQQKGLGRGLIIAALNWFHSRGFERVSISTQVTNLASQKVWIRLGFEPAEVFYTFHKWSS